jgi:hypothetical protein
LMDNDVKASGPPNFANTFSAVAESHHMFLKYHSRSEKGRK